MSKQVSSKMTAPGSFQTDWILAHANSTVADTGRFLSPGNAALSANVQRLPVPDGATRIWMRQVFSVASASFTANAVVVPICGDNQGHWWRVDTTDQNGTGVTLTVDSTVGNNMQTSDGLFYLGDLVTLTGNDLLAGSQLRILVATASNLGSATQQVWIKYGN
jgi:hypothetical protein